MVGGARAAAGCAREGEGLGEFPLPAPAQLRTPRAARTSRGRPARTDAWPRQEPASPRRIPAHRPALHAARGARRGSLLPLLPRARQGLVLEGVEGEGRFF